MFYLKYFDLDGLPFYIGGFDTAQDATAHLRNVRDDYPADFRGVVLRMVPPMDVVLP